MKISLTEATIADALLPGIRQIVMGKVEDAIKAEVAKCVGRAEEGMNKPNNDAGDAKPVQGDGAPVGTVESASSASPVMGEKKCPREPTEEMLRAARNAWSGYCPPQMAGALWKAMYDAAPTPQ